MCVVDSATGDIVFEENRILKVKEGARGLRQSDGFFQHTHNLPEIFARLGKSVNVQDIEAIGVSTMPRNAQGSYMPVFHAGLLFAKTLATALELPIYETSHQDGHVMAALATCGIEQFPQSFMTMHLSGGTTELLHVFLEGEGFDIKKVGESLDISFGQLVDRLGVKMGFPFPSGVHMDQCGMLSESKAHFKVAFKFHYNYNISGLENKYMKLLNTSSNSEVCRHIFNTLGYMIEKWIDEACKGLPVIIAGGVASNSHIKAMLSHKSNVYFAKAKYARDNAYGVAELTRRHVRGVKNSD
jgi:N6-L-threonylcarbamoyladenine synthase